MKRLHSAILALTILASSGASAAPVPNLKSLSVNLPDAGEMFSGAGSDAANSNCLRCHSVEMVADQPNLPRSVWEAEVNKMIKVFKAPIAKEDVSAIVDYLASIKGAK